MFEETNEPFPEKEVGKEAQKYGAYLGVILLAIGIASTYLVMNVSNFWISILMSSGVHFIVLVGLAAYFSLEMRKTAGGYWTFKQAFRGIFAMLAVVVLIVQIGTVAFNAIDPEPQQKVIEKTINSSIETLESLGADDETIDKQVADLEKQREDLGTFSISRTVYGLGISLIMYAVFALILSAFFKKERPVLIDN